MDWNRVGRRGRDDGKGFKALLGRGFLAALLLLLAEENTESGGARKEDKDGRASSVLGLVL
jgi:hypothetical protein